MATKSSLNKLEIITNSNPAKNHSRQFEALFSRAKHFDCLVAFASYSGFKFIIEHLKLRLRDPKFSANIFIGLDYFHTEPAVLDALFLLSQRSDNRGRLLFYINNKNSKRIFHPKLYAFQNIDGTLSLIAGSANMTNGGLKSNHELSMFCKGAAKKNVAAINSFASSLLCEKEMVEATKPRLDEYRIERNIFNAYRNLARRKAKNSSRKTALESASIDDLKILQDHLDTMKGDRSKYGFEQATETRGEGLKAAGLQLKTIRETTGHLSKERFLSLYEPLCGKSKGLRPYWHSGGLMRGKTVIASKHANEVRGALKDFDNFFKKSPKITPFSAFEYLLERFKLIKGAGTNVITEILHTYDSKRFAVMNQNSVAGISLVLENSFPSMPGKLNLSPIQYATFCEEAEVITKKLGLLNFSELDALFNYIYWKEWENSDSMVDDDNDNDDEEMKF